MDIGNILTKGVDSIFFLSLVGFIVFLILIVIHYNVTPIFPFLSDGHQANLITQLDIINSQTRNVKGKAELADTKLTFDKILNFKYENFSISFDIFLNGQYISTDVPRILMYFDTAQINISSNNVKEDHLLTLFGNSNFLVYCDPVKNDLIVSAITINNTTKYLEKVALIENIPINNPFQITLVITSKFFEVYMNKALIKTYKLQNTLNTATPSSLSASLFAPISFLQDTIKIGNVQYFDGALRSDQVRYGTNTLKDKSFFS